MNSAKKHSSIKFQLEISERNITFLEPEVFINNGIYTENKPERQTFFSINQKTLASLKNSIPYMQTL